MTSLFSVGTWLPQLILVVIPLVTGVLAYKTARRHKPGQPSQPRQPQTVLNGYATMIRETLERLDWLRSERERLLVRNMQLETRLAELEKQLHAPAPAPAPAAPTAPPARQTSKPRATHTRKPRPSHSE